MRKRATIASIGAALALGGLTDAAAANSPTELPPCDPRRENCAAYILGCKGGMINNPDGTMSCIIYSRPSAAATPTIGISPGPGGRP